MTSRPGRGTGRRRVTPGSSRAASAQGRMSEPVAHPPNNGPRSMIGHRLAKSPGRPVTRLQRRRRCLGIPSSPPRDCPTTQDRWNWKYTSRLAALLEGTLRLSPAAAGINSALVEKLRFPRLNCHEDGVRYNGSFCAEPGRNLDRPLSGATDGRLTIVDRRMRMGRQTAGADISATRSSGTRLPP